MRLKRLLCMLLCSVAFLSGCSKTENSVTNTSEKSINAGYFGNYCKLVEGDSGYYIMDTLYPYAISFIEKGTDKRIYLCGKPDCEHDDGRGGVLTTCNSYVGEIMLSSLQYHDGWLYMLSYDRATYNVSLSRISKDGVAHESLGVIDHASCNQDTFSYVIVGDKVYYTQKLDSNDSTNKAYILEISLSTKEIREIYSYESYQCGIAQLKYYNNYLYFKEINNDLCGLSRLELTTGKRESLVDSHVSGYTINASRNQLLCWISGAGMYKLDLGNMTSDFVESCNNNSYYIDLACDDKYIYLSNVRNKYYSDDQSFENSITILDLNGKQVGVISLENMKAVRVTPICITEDRIYIETVVEDVGRVYAYMDKEKMFSQDARFINVQKQ